MNDLAVLKLECFSRVSTKYIIGEIKNEKKIY